MDEFAVEYESFFMDHESKYDVFDFDMCFVNFIVDVAAACDTSAVSLDLKLLPNSLKYVFRGPDESLPVIIASDLE